MSMLFEKEEMREMKLNGTSKRLKNGDLRTKEKRKLSNIIEKVDNIEKGFKIYEGLQNEDDYTMYKRAAKYRRFLFDCRNYRYLKGVRFLIRKLYLEVKVDEVYDLEDFVDYFNVAKFDTSGKKAQYHYPGHHDTASTLRELKAHFKYTITTEIEEDECIKQIRILSKNPSGISYCENDEWTKYLEPARKRDYYDGGFDL